MIGSTAHWGRGGSIAVRLGVVRAAEQVENPGAMHADAARQSGFVADSFQKTEGFGAARLGGVVGNDPRRLGPYFRKQQDEVLAVGKGFLAQAGRGFKAPLRARLRHVGADGRESLARGPFGRLLTGPRIVAEEE